MLHCPGPGLRTEVLGVLSYAHDASLLLQARPFWVLWALCKLRKQLLPRRRLLLLWPKHPSQFLPLPERLGKREPLSDGFSGLLAWWQLLSLSEGCCQKQKRGVHGRERGPNRRYGSVCGGAFLLHHPRWSPWARPWARRERKQPVLLPGPQCLGVQVSPGVCVCGAVRGCAGSCVHVYVDMHACVCMCSCLCMRVRVRACDCMSVHPCTCVWWCMHVRAFVRQTDSSHRVVLLILTVSDPPLCPAQ